jgi:hypothetical protein
MQLREALGSFRVIVTLTLPGRRRRPAPGGDLATDGVRPWVRIPSAIYRSDDLPLLKGWLEPRLIRRGGALHPPRSEWYGGSSAGRIRPVWTGGMR